jgi:hypothetical protein
MQQVKQKELLTPRLKRRMSDTVSCAMMWTRTTVAKAAFCRIVQPLGGHEGGHGESVASLFFIPGCIQIMNQIRCGRPRSFVWRSEDF